uniref:Phospholipid phosphatase 1 n=1 Tax=Sinocyclocheilus grahami TaxID=75366 RepID=A0A672NMP0_SINGR
MFETRGIPFILLDIACLILVGLPFAILTIQHKSFKRGFFCNDDSINYPYKEDTISYQLLGGVMIPITMLTMIIGECLSVYLNCVKSKSFCNSYVACIYKAIGTFLFGAAMSQSLTDIAKYSIGRLRPHFLDVCRPDWMQINCTGGAYIEDFVCTGDSTKVNEGRLSFYSGHSSFSMYCMLFLAVSVFYLSLNTDISGSATVTVNLNHITSSHALQVFCVSDFFKKKVEPQKEAEIPHTTLQETPTNGNHYENPN